MRAPRRSPRARTTCSQNLTFDHLEDRRLLAGDLIHTVTDLVPVKDRISILRSHLDFDQNESVQLLELQRDQYGFAHFKYQLNQNGVPVQNSVYSVHVKGGQVVSLSGKYIPVADTVANPKIAVREATAFRGALDFVGAEKYIWQDPVAAAMEGLPADRPQGELVYYTPRGGQTELAYKFDVFSIEPFDRDYIFVNATNGTKIIGTSERIHGGDEPGTGTSLYDGQVDLTVDKYDPGSGVFEYRLREGEEGLPEQRPIRTLNVNGGINTAAATDYTSPTTDFSTPDVQNGVQVHYGAESTYDYFLLVHGRDSFDGNGTTMRSFASYRTGWVNASWTGSSVRFGDGDGINYGPLTALDVVGHEYGHGVVDFSADLDYSYQSGALNESFADIFGNAVERFGRGTTDWLIGADFALAGDPFRSMSDPKLYGDPDTFMGENWHPSSDDSDNGGVHTNSGVQNKWFYILSEGEADTNDLGWTYDVAGIGFDAAAAIAYRNLTVYLTSDSDYADSRIGAIQAAIDIFGAGSEEHLQTEDAWRAVGLDGPPEIEFESLDGQFQPLRTLGSQVYYATATGTVESQVGDVTDEAARDIFSVRLDANQTVSAVVRGTDGVFEPVVRIHAPGAENQVTPFDDTEIANSIAADVAGIYTIFVSGGISGTLGNYELAVYLNADIEAEPITGIDNNNILNAQDISLSSVNLGNSEANRMAVLGSLSSDDAGSGGGGGGGGNIVSGDDFESGSLGANWSTSSSSAGRIRVTDAYGSAGGSFALIMDSDTNGVYALNEAIWTFNMANVDTPFLNFSYMEWFDETDPLPITFVGSEDGDGVSISDDGVIWHTLLNSTQSPAGDWENVAFDMLAFATATGLVTTGDLYVKFQQYDNQSIDIADGRGFDEISISEGQLDGGGGGEGVGDWYTFVLREDETVSLAVASTESYGADLSVELYSPFGALLETEIPLATTNVDGFISQYTNPFPDVKGEDTYFFAKVVGDEVDYNLVITRGAEFNVEVADEIPMDISFVDGALGYVSSGEAVTADPDDYDDNTVLDTAISGLLLSNEVTGGSVFAEDVMGAFSPATGTKTFAPNLAGLYGWREGDNELRVDFAAAQMSVSLDVVSNDANTMATDQGIMRAYSADGTLLQEVMSAAVNRFQTDTMTISRPVADIAYIVATGLGGDETPLDNLVYSTAVDVDIYQFEAFDGQQIAFGGFLPGGGPNEFVNGLNQETGSALRMELFDPNGKSLATGAKILQAIAVSGGTYELHVTADAGAGEYYIGGNPEDILVNGVDFGPIGSVVADGYAFVESDVYAVGQGYGWTALGQVSFLEQRRGSDLLIDLARLKTGSFAVDVVNATYNITIHMGQVRNADGMTITVEGVPDTFAPNAGPNVVRNYTVAITDGQISLDFSGLGGLNEFFNISGITIARASSRPFAGPSPGRNEVTNLSFPNTWSIGDAVIGNQMEENGIREIATNTGIDPSGRILLGSQKINELEQSRDDSFAKVFGAKNSGADKNVDDEFGFLDRA